MLETVFGVAGNICSTALFIPNAVTVYRNRRDSRAMRGVSFNMQLLILLNATLWTLYAWVADAWWAAAPGILYVPLALYVMYLIYGSRRNCATEDDNLCICGWPEIESEHDVFCIVPAGFGTRMKCDGVTPMKRGYIPLPKGARVQPRGSVLDLAGRPLHS